MRRHERRPDDGFGEGCPAEKGATWSPSYVGGQRPAERPTETLGRSRAMARRGDDYRSGGGGPYGGRDAFNRAPGEIRPAPLTLREVER